MLSRHWLFSGRECRRLLRGHVEVQPRIDAEPGPIIQEAAPRDCGACVDDPLGARGERQSLTAVRRRSCVRPLTRHGDRWPRWVPRTSPKHGCGIGMPVQHTGFLVRRLDRSSSPTALLAPRHLRAGQAAAAAPAASVATFLLPRYASPVAIMAHTMRAILLARATAASLRGLRSSQASSQAEALLLPGLAKRMTVVAPSTSSCRSLSLPARLMPPRR
jgi:hypothetical protein